MYVCMCVSGCQCVCVRACVRVCVCVHTTHAGKQHKNNNNNKIKDIVKCVYIYICVQGYPMINV